MNMESTGAPAEAAEQYGLVNEPSDVPEFADLAEEHAFWRTHRVSSSFWSKHVGNVPPELRAPRDLSRLPPEEWPASTDAQSRVG